MTYNKFCLCKYICKNEWKTLFKSGDFWVQPVLKSAIFSQIITPCHLPEEEKSPWNRKGCVIHCFNKKRHQLCTTADSRL